MPFFLTLACFLLTLFHEILYYTSTSFIAIWTILIGNFQFSGPFHWSLWKWRKLSFILTTIMSHYLFLYFDPQILLFRHFRCILWVLLWLIHAKIWNLLLNTWASNPRLYTFNAYLSQSMTTLSKIVVILTNLVAICEINYPFYRANGHSRWVRGHSRRGRGHSRRGRGHSLVFVRLYGAGQPLSLFLVSSRR